VLGPARAAFTDGMHVVAGISAVLLAVVAVTMVTLLRRVAPSGAGEAPAQQLAEVSC
jgi:DHA2 family multidrug resistance protein-like MFS transporter